jgi:protein pelota
MQNVINADAIGAISQLLLTDATVQHHKHAGTFDQLDTIMKNVDSKKGQVHIISSAHSGGKKLDGIGGIGAILRFPIHS